MTIEVTPDLAVAGAVSAFSGEGGDLPGMDVRWPKVLVGYFSWLSGQSELTEARLKVAKELVLSDEAFVERDVIVESDSALVEFLELSRNSISEDVWEELFPTDPETLA